MALAPLLYNITFDSQTRILYFWDKAGHEIYHCEIPSPAPALPTVSMSYAYPSQLWNYPENIGAGSSSVLRDQNGNALSYDSTKSYSALKYYTSTSDSAGTIDTNVSIGASGSFLALFNNGSSQITVQRVNVATCNSTDATVITVYDSSNNPYNAFKYTSDGTDNYYVLDGVQTDWTDDLSSIGYSLTIHAFTAWLRADKSPGMYTGSWHELYGDDGNYILLPGVSNDQLSVVDWYDENDNLVEFPESVSSRGGLITSLYSDSRLMFTADSWPYPYTAPAMLTKITYVINQ